MKCKECGAELPSESVFCLKCGSKVEIEETPEKKESEEQSNEQVEVSVETVYEDIVSNSNETVKNLKIPFKKILLFLIILIGLIIGAILSAHLYFIPEHKYNYAQELFENKEYQSSISVFRQIADYKNSNEMINECKYQIAIGYDEKENYADALKVLEEISNYKDSAEKIDKIHYKWGKKSFDSSSYKNAIEHLSACNNIEDSASVLKEAYYKFGMSLYEEGNFDEAASNLRKSENPEAQKYIEESEFLQKFQGVWYINIGFFQSDKGVFYIDFDGWKCTEKRTYYFRSNLNYEYTYDYKIKDNKVIVLREDRTWILSPYENYTFYFDDDDELKWVSTDFWIGDKAKETTMRKVESGNSVEKKHPAIGMTADEVRNSTWGSPDDINKSVTAYGTTEQWVYGNGKYIYFEDGIVTSISY